MGITWICSYLLLLILFLSSFATSRSIVKTLPGFDGDLPFMLETGYVGVGEMDDVQLFYSFVESQREPSSDPLHIWISGWPEGGFESLASSTTGRRCWRRVWLRQREGEFEMGSGVWIGTCRAPDGRR
ncbi:serine carboxypeptidase-like 7 [Quercus suber]|uniref:Serine carboxypeptidase-like 7 n=1 Tax=Quercus suber TaxID=58331 RepID=A0AAW0LY99_QUESU